MKTFRFLAILLIFTLLFSFVSCKNDNEDENVGGDGVTDEGGESSDEGGENDPDENLGMPDYVGDNENNEGEGIGGNDSDVNNGGNTDSGSGEQSGGGVSGNEGVEVDPGVTITTYYYSVKSDRFHIYGCYHIDNINAELLATYEGSLDDMLAMGKIACTFCLSSDEDGGVTDEVIPEGTTYILNVKTKKVHEVTCHSAKTISAENKAYSKLSSDELILLGYELCENCVNKTPSSDTEQTPSTDTDVALPEEGN